MIDVYYPYFEAESTWQELRYSLRSIEQNFKFDYRVVIVGDLPKWVNPDSVLHIPHQRIEGITQNTLYDAITKLLIFCNHPDTSLHFLRMYDDIYILKEVDLPTVGQFKAMYPFSQVPARDGTWWDQLYRTIDTLRAKGYEGYNTETHLPELFNKENMSWIISAYSALENRLLTSTLYFTTFFPFSKPLLFSKEFAIQFYNNIDGPFYTSSEGDLTAKCQGKTYLNHNDAGLNENLKKTIHSLFPVKSRFEL
jgi:hypothetical protein